MDDFISRKDLMKKIAHHTVHDSMSYVTFERATVYEMVKGDMFGLVKDAPAVASMPRWISVEDDLPAAVITPCLVYFDGDTYIADWSHDKYDNDWWFYVEGEYEPLVTHWMPLPEPPKEE